MKTIKVYCGKSIESECHFDNLHPVNIVLRAKQLIEENKSYQYDTTYYSNHPDFVSAMYYIGKKEGVNVEFYLDGKSLGNDIDEIFDDFNKAFDLIDELRDIDNEEDN